MIYIIIIIMVILYAILFHDLELKELIIVLCLMVLFSIYSIIIYKQYVKVNNKKYFEKGYWEGANAMYEYKNSNPKLLNMKLQKLKEKL